MGWRHLYVEKSVNDAILDALTALGTSQWTPFVTAMRALIEAPPDRSGFTSLHCLALLACPTHFSDEYRENNNDINKYVLARVLLFAGLDVNARSKWGITPLYLAVTMDIEMVRLFLAHGADANVRAGAINGGETPLFCARDTDTIRLLLEAGGNVLAKNNHGHTLLHSGRLICADKKRTADEFRLLLEVGAKTMVNAQNKNGDTPLHSVSDQADVCRLFLEAGAIVDKQNDRGRTPLHNAIVCCEASPCLETLRILLNASGNVNLPDKDGCTPLLHFCSGHDGWDREGWEEFVYPALYNDGEDAIRLLLNAGADVTAVNNRGNTCLHLLHFDEFAPFARMFLDAGANPNARNHSNDTPMHLACSKGNLDVVKVLVEKGASLLAVNGEGLTPLDSTDEGQHEILRELLVGFEESLFLQEGSRSILTLLQQSVFLDDDEPNVQISLGQLSIVQYMSVLHCLADRDPNTLCFLVFGYGELALHIACSSRAPPVVIQFFQERDPNLLLIRNQEGNLPLHEACQCGGPDDVIRLLGQQTPSNIRAANHVGALPLHLLCTAEDANLVTLEFLVGEFPKSVELQTYNGDVALTLAAENNASLDCIFFLAKKSLHLFMKRGEDSSLGRFSAAH